MVIVHLYNWWGLSTTYEKRSLWKFLFLQVKFPFLWSSFYFYGQVKHWWCTKIVSKLIVHTCVNGCTWKTKEKNESKDIDGVPAKDPPKVKSEESSNNAIEYELYKNCAYLFERGFWRLYSGVDLTLISWGRSLFLIGRTLHQIFGFFRMVFLVDDPQLWLGIGCKAFPY